MTVKIICDTSADLNLEGDKTLYNNYDVSWVPMHVIFGDKDYSELSNLKTSEFYEKLYESEVQPTTSQSTQHDLLKAYEDYGNKYEEIISMHLSSGISGAVSNAQFAKKVYEKSNPDGAKIFIYDSKTASSPFGLAVIKAAQLAKQGLSAQDIIKELDRWSEIDRTFFFTVADLKWLFRGGRLSKAKYYLGSILSKSPVITFIDGKLEVIKSVSGMDKTIDAMMDLHVKHHNVDYNELTLHFVEAEYKKETEIIAERILKNYPGMKMGKIFVMGGVIAAHTGPRTICTIVTKNFEY
ncbi:MAG: DegV family protein [Candidatus Heimdallarchaeaceae archaeon]